MTYIGDDTYTWSWTPTILGYNEVQIYAEDNLGDGTEVTYGFNTIDTMAPFISWVSVDKNPIYVGEVLTISASVSDNFGVASVSLNMGGTKIGLIYKPSSGNYEAKIIITQPLGPRSYVVNAVDYNNNSVSMTGSFTVFDKPPETQTPTNTDSNTDKTSTNPYTDIPNPFGVAGYDISIIMGLVGITGFIIISAIRKRLRIQ
jgi:hypothetical protein